MRQQGSHINARSSPETSAITAPPPAVGLLSDPVRHWFDTSFPQGATPAQELAWPAVATGENVLLISPTGTGKTLAAFLAILDRLFRARADGTLRPGLACVYVSPLRSLNYDVERNLRIPLLEIGQSQATSPNVPPLTIGVRTGDTSPYERRKLRDHPPHILITTPESLSLLLSQASWSDHWKSVGHIVIDEIHALAPTKRGADLAVSLERLSALAAVDPIRIGLSATCRAPDVAANFLVGPTRTCRVIDAPPPAGSPSTQITVETLIRPGEAPQRGTSYRRLLRRLRRVIGQNRTTVIFANTRAFAEKITHDLRHDPSERDPMAQDDSADITISAHHSALEAGRRREIEHGLKTGRVRAVVTSTSLELGVDIGTADVTVQVGLPGGVSRCLQRVGRSGHRRDVASRGILLAATPAELVGGIITAQAARERRVEPLRMLRAPLDVVCQQLIGMACAGECSSESVFELFRKTGPFADLSRDDFDACLQFLAGELAAPAGAYEPEPGSAPRWTSARIWKHRGLFGVRSWRVVRWFRSNVGTIQSEESVRVMEGGVAVGTLEAAYAERLVSGDRFVLDGRAWEVRRLESAAAIVHARAKGGEFGLPRWTSDRQSLTGELAGELASFRARASAHLTADGPPALRAWLIDQYLLSPAAAAVLVELFEAQEQCSQVPSVDELLVEESPAPLTVSGGGTVYVFHAPLHRAACEALARATGARLGRRFGRDLTLAVADLGWSVCLPEDARLEADDIEPLLDLTNLADDVLEGLDRGELLARRFRHVAATAMMVLRNHEPGLRVRVGGLGWASSRLYPLVKAACPDHPLLRQTRREVLEELLDVPAATQWLRGRPIIRFRRLATLSPFATSWIEPAPADALHYESSADAIKRLHARLVASAGRPGR
jgi:ATP-dependent Lhr-like helicase